ncbi:MAG: hypothetical protein WCL61_01010, partial [bacterium]
MFISHLKRFFLLSFLSSILFISGLLVYTATLASYIDPVGSQAGSLDNCPNLNNPNQADSDHDLIGDACDTCPNDANPRTCGGLATANPEAISCASNNDCSNLAINLRRCLPSPCPVPDIVLCSSTTQIFYDGQCRDKNSITIGNKDIVDQGICGDGYVSINEEECDWGNPITLGPKVACVGPIDANQDPVCNQNNVTTSGCYQDYSSSTNSLNCHYTYCGDGITQKQNGRRLGGLNNAGMEQCDQTPSGYGSGDYGLGSSSTNQYFCDKCVQTGGFCGDGDWQTKGNLEACDNSAPLGANTNGIALATNQSNETHQYSCTNINSQAIVNVQGKLSGCQNTGGYCGDGTIQYCASATQQEINGIKQPLTVYAINNTINPNLYNIDVINQCYTNPNGFEVNSLKPGLKKLETCDYRNWNVQTQFSNVNNQYGCANDCQQQDGFCGDGAWQDRYEGCEPLVINGNIIKASSTIYEQYGYGGGTSETNAYSCTPVDSNEVNSCQDTGGFCGDGIIQNGMNGTIDAGET